MRQISYQTDEMLAREWLAEIGRDFTDREMPFEVRRLGRTMPVGGPNHCLAPVPLVERADRSGEQLGHEDQTIRVRARELPTPPCPVLALRRTTRLDPDTHDPTLIRGELPNHRRIQQQRRSCDPHDQGSQALRPLIRRYEQLQVPHPGHRRLPTATSPRLSTSNNPDSTPVIYYLAIQQIRNRQPTPSALYGRPM